MAREKTPHGRLQQTFLQPTVVFAPKVQDTVFDDLGGGGGIGSFSFSFDFDEGVRSSLGFCRDWLCRPVEHAEDVGYHRLKIPNRYKASS